MNKVITNRELLRNYKEIKAQLMNGELEGVQIPQKDGRVLQITMVGEERETSAQRFLRRCRENPLKGKIQRPQGDLFDW